ncbi:MAG: YraN family protein [Atribacterota bacterium]
MENIGEVGERLASKYLVKNGYHILEINYTVPFGEIDIIAEKKRCISFIEVKCRKSQKYGLPEEAITSHKKKKIIKVAQFYINKKKIKHKYFRFDVISVQFEESLLKKIRHITNAFILE